MPTLTHAMILAAGRGERMQPLTRRRAKPALPLLGSTLVGRIVRHLSQAGIRTLAVNAHHAPETIEAAVRANADTGARIELFVEREQLMGTGGALFAPRMLLGESSHFLLHNADTLVRAPVAELYAAAQGERRLGALLVRSGPTAGYSGAITIQNGLMVDVIRGAEQIATATLPLATYLGVGILRRDVLQQVRGDIPSDLFGSVLMPWLHEGWKLAVVPYDGPWLEFTSPRSYLANLRRAVSAARKRGAVELPGGRVDVSAHRCGTTFCADESAAIDCGAELDGAVMLESGAQAQRGSFVRDSLLMPQAVAAAGAYLDGVVVDAGVHVPPGNYKQGCLCLDDNGALSFTPFAEAP